MSVRRRGSSASVGAGSSVDCSIPTREAGDLLFAYVGGGNQVTSYSGTWQSVGHYTGVEAQGELLTRVATGDADDELHLTFDGGDPYRVVVDSHYSSRGYGVLYEVVGTGRQGTLGTPLPPVSFTQPVAANVGNIVTTYIFTRNGATVPVVSPGTELHSYTGGHAYGFWEDIHPDQVTDIAIDLPTRTGHFRANVRFFEWEWTAWRDDSVPVNVGLVGTANPATTYAGISAVGGGEHVGLVEGIDTGAQHDAVTAAWNDATPDADMSFGPTFTGVVRLSGGHFQSRAAYNVHWLTVNRTAPGTATSGALPPEVYTGGSYVDPLVFEVEWEPTNVPVGFDLTVQVKDVGGQVADLDTHLDRPLHVKLMRSGFTGIYDPDTMSANVLAAMDTWHTIDVPSDWVAGDVISTTGSDHAIPVGTFPFAVAVVDDFTQTHTFPPTYSGPDPSGPDLEAFTIQWAYAVFLEALMAPRYRLKREVADIETWIRQLPRDDEHGPGLRLIPPTKARRLVGGIQ